MILDEILAHKRREVADRERVRPLQDVRSAAEARSATVVVGSVNGVDAARGQTMASSFGAALRTPAGVAVIAEIKRKSPSAGALRTDLSIGDLAHAYAANGAAGLSVLTDSLYFGGADSDLEEARAASGLPVLRKDFVVNPYQVYEARALGADAVLLIVRAVAPSLLKELVTLADEVGLDALVETHSAVEVDRALAAGARIIGVNNRDLDTLQTDVSLAPRLRQLVPLECIFVAESGISQPEQIVELAAAGVDAVLIGESLLRAPDPGAKLRSLVWARREVERIP